MIVTLHPHADFAPVPRVEIRFEEVIVIDGGDASGTGPVLDGGDASGTGPALDGGPAAQTIVNLPEGTDTVTLWWSSQGKRDRVSGAIRRGFISAFLDLEAGFDVPTSYEIECFSGSTPLGSVGLGTVTLPWEGEENGCVIQQPLNPNLNAVVTNLEGSWPSITWNSPGETVTPQGVVTPSLVSFGPRGAATGVPVNFAAPTREVSARVHATLSAEEAVPVWLIRANHGLLPRRFFAHVKTLKEVDFDLTSEGEWSTFETTVDEVARPAPGLLVSPLSYDDLDISYESYDARDAAYPSYDASDTDWSLAGAAG